MKTKYYSRKHHVGVYTIPGYPADCVLLGLSGLFPNSRPDLVISGINGSPNGGPGWFSSGTIGAVRMAAFLGVPGIAFSGIAEDSKNYTKSLRKITKWIAEFLKSDVVEDIGPNSYLTVSFPKIPVSNIKGVKIAKRQIRYDRPQSIRFKKVYGDSLNQSGNKTIWVYSPLSSRYSHTEKNDMYYLKEGYVVIVPMSINENNNALLRKLKKDKLTIPEFNK